MEHNDAPYLFSKKPLKPEFKNLEKIVITSTDFSIGRGLKNSVVVPSLPISRNHCIIKKTNNKSWLIEDYSSWGIEINGVKLGKDNKKIIKHKDVISLEPSHEFVYLFIDPVQRLVDKNNSHGCPKKRMKLENDDTTDVINNVKIKFEQSQTCEIQHIENKIQNAKEMQKTSIILKDQLHTEMMTKMQLLQNHYTVCIENLKGEKSAVEEQKALLIEERDKQLATVKKEMEGKISTLMKQIEKHNETESELVVENNLLKQKLLKERKEFLVELNKESSSKKDLLDILNAKIREQEETRLMEKKELQETLQIETKRLKEAKEKELKQLEEQKKSRELELLQELNELKQNLETKMKETEQQKFKVEQVLNNQMEQMKKVSDEEKIKMKKLMHDREVLQKKLIEAQLNANKSIEKLQTQVQDRETELAALAADRIQKHAEQSTEVINSLLEQLEKVKSQLRSVENEKEILKTVNETGELSVKENTVAEFTDIMENELQCSICAELFVSATTLNCSHTFCKYCITMWKKKKRECPICRTTINSECKSLVLDSFIEKMVGNLSAEMKQKRLNLLNLRKELESAKAHQCNFNCTRRSSSYEEIDNFSVYEFSERAGEEEYQDLDHFFWTDEYAAESYSNRGSYNSSYGAISSASAASSGNFANDSATINSQLAPLDTSLSDIGEYRGGHRRIIRGTAGSYYGGYGRCLNCGHRGHWAPGCPLLNN